MKKTVTHTLTVLLALALTIGAGGARAYNTPDFTDVAAGTWAYAPIMQMADEGIIKGTSSTTFAPEMKVSAAMWLTLLGRAVYNDEAKAAAQEGDTWHSAHVRVAKRQGRLNGTNITLADIEGEVSRYDMAYTLWHAMVQLKAALPMQAESNLWANISSKITDFAKIPVKYGDMVIAAYARGLLTGDDNGNFNGDTTMTRAEAATVMSRLLELKNQVETKTLPPIEPETPRTGKMVTFTVTGKTYHYEAKQTNPKIPLPGVAFTFYYKDGRALASGVSDKEGNFVLNVTVDEADYSKNDRVYYTVAEDYVDPSTGLTYKDLYYRSLLTLSTFHDNWQIQLDLYTLH